MPSTGDQATGDRKNNLWMQPQNELWYPENNVNFSSIFGNPDEVQPENGLLNSEDNIVTNVLMMQAAVGRDGNAGTSSNYTNDLATNGSASEDYATANLPSSDAAMKQILALFAPPVQSTDNNIESQHLSGNIIVAEECREEPDYVLHTRTPHGSKRTRKSSGLSSEEWQKWKPDIYNLYVIANYTLKETRAEMAKKGFYAEPSAYKRRFTDWGWKTYERDNGSGNSGGEPSLGRPQKRARGRALSSLSTLREENSQPNTSRGSTMVTSNHLPFLSSIHSSSTHNNNTHLALSHVYPGQSASVHFNPSTLCKETSLSNGSNGTTAAVFTPSRHPHTYFNSSHIYPTHFRMGIPASVSKTKFERLFGTIINEVQNLYISSLTQKKWQVEKQREVEEETHDKLYYITRASLDNYSSLSPELGYEGFQKSLRILEKVVGVEEGAHYGLFSLPAIWESFLIIIRNQRPDLALEFISWALKLAVHKFGRVYPLVQVLLSLQQVWATEPDQVEEVIFASYRRCIADVREKLGDLNLNYLCLRTSYASVFGSRLIDETQVMVDNIRSMIKIAEEEKGLDGGPNSFYTLNLLNLALHMLHSASMADEAEKAAKELLFIAEQRKLKTGGRLDVYTLKMLKGIKYVLGNFCLERMNYHQAIDYLECFLSFKIMDEWDTDALEKLERCYLAVGRDDDFKKVWQMRWDISQRLLRETDGWPVRVEDIMNHHEERDDNDSADMSEERGSSEETVVSQVEEISEESMQEDEGDGFEDADIEIKLVQEQLAELNQRLNVLKQAKRKGKGKRL